jgi:hypothetical protein
MTITTQADAAAALAKMGEQARGHARELAEECWRHLQASRGHALPGSGDDLTAAQWFGTLAADLSVLPNVIRWTSGQTGIAIATAEVGTLAEAERVITLETPEMFNEWIAGHSSGIRPFPQPRAEGVPLRLYIHALVIARSMLAEALRTFERVAGDV